MKLKLTWSTNPDGARRALMQTGSELRFWVLVTNEKDDPLDGQCKLSATIRPTGLLRWLHRAGPHWRRAPRTSQQRLQLKRVSEERAEFLVVGQIHLWLPYWVLLRARQSDTEDESIKQFVVPRANRWFSLAFVGVFAVMLSYGSWLWLSVASETVPEGLATIVVTASAVLGPFAAFVSPLVSATVRRFALDALVSGSFALAASLGVWLLHRSQAPVFLENYTPTEINVTGSPGRQVVVPPGQGLVVPTTHLDPGWLRSARGDKPSPENPDWFRDGHYCVRRDRTGAGGKEPAECVELRALSLSDKLQRWFAFGETIPIGCESVVGLEADTIDAWKASKSCRHDPALEVKRKLTDHRRWTKDADFKAAPPACTEPSGTVTVREFAVPPTKIRTDTSSPLRLQQIDLTLPAAAALPGEALPSWVSQGEGPLTEVRLVPSMDDLGRPCATPYPRPCADDKSKSCNSLQVPPGSLATTISLGEQKLGRLACPNPPGRVFATRLRSKIVALTVFEEFEDKARSFYRQVSRYEVDNSELPSAWVFWCEPTDGRTSASKQKARRFALSAEVVLPRDWQPLEEWKVSVPSESRITSLDISVQERGRWGTLVCTSNDRERWLGLKELKNTRNTRLASAIGRAASDWHRPNGWYGYGESTLFPRWIWRCEDESGRLMDEPLTAELDDGTRGTLAVSGSFSPSPGAPCLIDPRTGQKFAGKAPKGKPAAALLSKYGVAGCDPKRSYLASLRDPQR